MKRSTAHYKRVPRVGQTTIEEGPASNNGEASPLGGAYGLQRMLPYHIASNFWPCVRTGIAGSKSCYLEHVGDELNRRDSQRERTVIHP